MAPRSLSVYRLDQTCSHGRPPAFSARAGIQHCANSEVITRDNTFLLPRRARKMIAKPKMQTAQYAIFLLICLTATQAVAQVRDLKAVLERAVSYVSAYEEKLGSIIGNEDYSQTAKWGGGRSQRRRLSSEFLLTRVGSTWFGVRNVLHVDSPELGTSRKLPEVGDTYDFSGVFAQPRDQLVQKLNEIVRSNTRYNIGDFVRTFNVPTYSLTILLPANFRGFSFEKGSEGRIENIFAWEAGFTRLPIRP